MTWENDKNETATQIYSFIADFDEKIYANEERREDSLIQCSFTTTNTNALNAGAFYDYSPFN